MTNRIERINEDIQRELAALIRDVKDPRVQQGMISITDVDATGDLRYAKVYISILGDVDEKELKKGLKSASPWLRRELGSRLTLRYTPELIFKRDSSIENGAHISGLLNGLKRGEAEDDES